MDNPRVSVVVTTYNYAKYLPFALESILEQTLQDLEIVLVNDGSTDNTNEVVQKYAHLQNLCYISQNNAGQAVAKNTGIHAARGAFIAFLDADDIWIRDKLEKQLPLFDDPQVGVVYGRTTYIDELNRPMAFEVRNPRLQPRKGWVVDHLVMDNFVPFSAAVVRRSCFDSVGVMNTTYQMGIDWDLWLRMALHFKFDFVDECLLLYRKSHAGQMSSKYETRVRDTGRILETFLESNKGRLPRSLVREAMAYTWCNRGYHSRETDVPESLHFYLKAMKFSPLYVPAYAGFCKTMAHFVLASAGLLGKKKA